MFSFQNWQQKLIFAGIASLFTIIGMLLSPVTAQRDKFGDIECTSLKVVGADGSSRVAIGAGGLGGYVVVYDDDKFGASKAELSISPRGGYIKANGKDGVSTVWIDFNAYGGVVSVYGKDKNGRQRASMRINEDGGLVTAYGKDGTTGAVLGVDEHGGLLTSRGKGEGKVTIGINENGNGAVSTWDNNGNQQ